MIELKYNFLNFIALLAVLVLFKGNPFSHSKIHLIFDFVNIHTKFFSCQKKKAIWKQKIFREFVHEPISSSLNFLLFCEEQNSLIYFKYYVNLVSFSANKRSWRQTWKCEAFATGQTAQHLINLTKLQSFLTWSLYFPICSVFLGRHDTNEWMTCSLVGKLFLFISAYKAAVSTLLVLTFSIFEVGSILDFIHSGFFPFGILSNSGFCPFGILSNLRFSSIWDFVQFKILSNLGFCPIRDFVQFGILSILDFVQFGILSIQEFVQFRILSVWNFVQFGILSILDFVHRDFVQFEILSNSGFCPFRIFSNSGFCPIWDFVQFGILSVWEFVQFRILSIWNFVQFGILSIWDFVQFGILSILDFVHRHFVQFGILSIPDFVQLGICPIRDFVHSGFVQFGILSNSRFCPFRILFVWDFVFRAFVQDSSNTTKTFLFQLFHWSPLEVTYISIS